MGYIASVDSEPINLVPGLLLNPDGSVTRHTALPELEPDSEFLRGAGSKDVRISKEKDLWVRIFIPKPKDEAGPKMPMLLFFHGGGFVSMSPKMILYHLLCNTLAIKLRAIVISVAYRLAPENKLPAAYEDAGDVLVWLKDQFSDSGDAWLARSGDPNGVFLMGDSAGANIAHNLFFQASKMEIGCLKIMGQILVEPFWGGAERTESEKMFCKGQFLSVEIADHFWSLALPEGADLDHPWCNPESRDWEEIRQAMVPKTLIFVGCKDQLHDRNCRYYQLMKSAGKEVDIVKLEDADHGFYMKQDAGARNLSLAMVDKVSSFLHDLYSVTEIASPLPAHFSGSPVAAEI